MKKAVGVSLGLFLMSSFSFVWFFLHKWMFLYVEGRADQTDHALNLLCSQPEPEQSGVGCVETPLLWPLTSSPANGIAHSLYYQECGQGNKLGLKTLDHISHSCSPVLTAKRALKLRRESPCQSICRWMLGRRLVAAGAAGPHSLSAGPREGTLAGMEVRGPTGRAACRKPGLGAPPRGATAGAGGSPPRQPPSGITVIHSQRRSRLCLCSSE